MGKVFPLLLLTSVLGVDTSLARAQQPAKMPRIGFLGQGKLSDVNAGAPTAFRNKLRNLGWVEGENLIIEWRFAKGVEERVPALIADFVRLKVDAMVLSSGRPVHIAKKATQTIPIIMTEIAYPVESGLIASLARPGGNLTGLTAYRHQLDGKRIEILKDVVPGLSRVAILWQSNRRGLERSHEATRIAARKLGMDLSFLGVRSADHFPMALKSIAENPATGLIAVHSQLIHSYRKELVAMVTEMGIPAIYQDRIYAAEGGLISYGSDKLELYGAAAVYVDKILKGARPVELPVERPRKFELVVNRKMAERMGITVPMEVIRWADEVIQ